jgi:hypothetical protein
MGWIVGDGWDYYANPADLAHSVWDSYTSNPSFQTPGRFGGQSLNAGWNDDLVKNFPGNESTIYVCFAYYRNDAQSPSPGAEWYFRLQDAGTDQVVICVNSDGSLTLRRGGTTGTIVATYPNAFPQALWTHFQCQVVIDPTAGSFAVRRNGAITNSFSATALNTRTTANSYANAFVLGKINGTYGNSYADDLLVFGSSGAAPNTWVGDVRAICLMANGDTAQKNFAPTPVTGFQFFNPAMSGGCSGSANTIYWQGPAWSPPRSGPVTKIQLSFNSTPTGNVQVAVYDATGPGGQPGNLLGTSSVLTNPASGSWLDFPFPTQVPVSAGQKYWCAVLGSVAFSITGQGFNNGYQMAQPFASGFPAVAPTMTVVNYLIPGFVVWSISNAATVSEALANGDTDYVASSNVNDEDLYVLDHMPVTPFAIIGVTSHVYIRKSDAGTRQGQIRVKSGTTEVAGTDTAVSSSWAYLSRVDTVDPSTGAAWTLAAVNALQVGQKVTL